MTFDEFWQKQQTQQVVKALFRDAPSFINPVRAIALAAWHEAEQSMYARAKARFKVDEYTKARGE